MKTIVIYGSSDDLIEIEGDCAGCNEYNFIDKPAFVELDLGDVFKVEYTDKGVWEIEHLYKGGLYATGGGFVKDLHGNSDSKNYSDIVTIKGEIGWLDVWEQYPPQIDEVRKKLSDMVADGGEFDRHRYLDDKQLLEIYSIVARAAREKK